MENENQRYKSARKNPFHKSAARTAATSILLFIASTASAQTWTQKGGSLNTFLKGFSYSPRLAVAPDGTIYVTWSQQSDPNVDQYSTPYAKKWDPISKQWNSLGGVIGTNPQGVFSGGEQGYAPSMVLVGTTPYVAWYESSGYGWASGVGSSIFVKHWTGSQWAADYNAANTTNQAINDTNCIVSSGGSNSCQGREPKLVVANGNLYVAWMQIIDKNNLSPPTAKPMYHAVNIKHLAGASWTQDAPPLTAFPGANALMPDFALDQVSGVPYVAISEYEVQGAAAADGGIVYGPSVVQVYQLSGGNWVQVGGNLNISASGIANELAMTVMNGVPYVAWQERAGFSGPYQIYVKHFNGTSWVQDGSTNLDVDAVNGDAGRPALANDGSKVWLAWTEGTLNQKSQLYVRSLSGGVWSAPQGSLNIDTVNGAPAEPALVVTNGAPQLAWVESDWNSYTKQLYVKGADAGAPQTTTLSQYGSDGPSITLPDNVWTYMNPGGDVLPSSGNVSDRGGLSYFDYDPGRKKAIAWIFYHSPYEAENQNALAEYDFNRNRWDTIEVTQAAWSEFLPGVGHTNGNFVIDTVHHLALDRGDLTLNAGTGYQTYNYDLYARRGKRMIPQEQHGARSDCTTSAFDADDDLMVSVGGTQGGTNSYDHNTNTWSVISSTFPQVACPGMVYDSQNHVFVMWGGDKYIARSSETWTLNPRTKVWTQMRPAVTPPGLREPFMTYDKTAGVSVMTEGYPGPIGFANGNFNAVSTSVWVYNLPQNTWTQISNMPHDIPLFEGADGMYLTYDSDDNVLLLRSGDDLTKLVAYRYNPSTLPPTPFVQLSTGVVYFQPQAIGATSSSVAIRLTNVGTGPLAINSMSLPAGAFTQTNNCPVAPTTLAYAASCTITVTFKPTSAGNFAGFLTINDNTPDGPQILQLYGSASGPLDAFPPARPTGLVLE